MPLPEGVLSVDLIVCERILREADNVPSAIRIIDLFRVAESVLASPNPTLVFFAMAFIRGDIDSDGNFVCRMKLTDPPGNEIGRAEQAISVTSINQGAPGGAIVVTQFNVVLVPGTYRLKVFLDDELQAQTTITIVRVAG